MVINKGDLFKSGDVFIDYPHEEVMFRWDYQSKSIFKKFYSYDESIEPVNYDSKLFNDAIQFGSEISGQAYLNGKKRNQ